MRLRLRLTGTSQVVPYDYHHTLTGSLHKWLGPNSVHDNLSLYGHSFLSDAYAKPDGLRFPHGASWTVGFHDDGLAQHMLAGIMLDPRVSFGMRVYDVQEEAIPSLGIVQRFFVNGLVIVRQQRSADDALSWSDKESLRRGRKINANQASHLIWSDPKADEALTRVLQWKLRQAGFEGEHLNARMAFDRSYERARTRLVRVPGSVRPDGTRPTISYRGSECPVLVHGTPEAVRFAYVVGAGELTGSGFGALTL